jgi:hypothetical protein
MEPDHLDRIPVHLYGGGGEMARGKRLTERLVLSPPSAKAAVNEVASMLGPRSSLLLPDARHVVRAHVDAACARLSDRGFAPVDLPDAFDLFEYGRRWGGAQARQIADRCDVFLPYFTRAFVEASFATPARERLTERLPYLLLGHLSPELRAMPTTSPWPPRSVAALALKNAAQVPLDLMTRAMRRLRRPRVARHPRTRERSAILESQLPRWRERHLDRDSPLWSIVDRQRIEHLTSDRVTVGQRLPHFVNLYQVMTAFAFEEDFEAWAGGRRAPPDAAPAPRQELVSRRP